MIYLASNSPRRAELLTQIGVSFTRVKADIIECQLVHESSENYVSRLAYEKAQAGFNNSDQDKPVLGADTIVIIDNCVLEKPQDKTHAKKMLQQLSGATHQVFTAVTVVQGAVSESILVCTDVTFKNLSAQEISDYWESGEPQDKAGGYGIQGLGAKFVTHINGSYSAVVGLPLYETDQLIKKIIRGSHYVG